MNDTASIVISNIQSTGTNSFSFDILTPNGSFVTSFYLRNAIDNDVDSFRQSLATIASSSGKVQLVWLIPVVGGLTAVGKAVMDHCSDVIQASRMGCSTPPCSFKAGFCSGDCNCPPQ